ncbi:hypothetical protein PQX77_017037 [Marasmius sp. AFHP31]|nr:hypothetical protein PQX77_017037 [Marasmius sp. AFHP31]
MSFGPSLKSFLNIPWQPYIIQPYHGKETVGLDQDRQASPVSQSVPSGTYHDGSSILQWPVAFTSTMPGTSELEKGKVRLAGALSSLREYVHEIENGESQPTSKKTAHRLTLSSAEEALDILDADGMSSNDEDSRPFSPF